MRPLLTSVFAVVLSFEAHAGDPVLSAQEAARQLQVLKGVCGTSLHLGSTFKFAAPDAAPGRPYYEIMQEISALKSLGVVDTVDQPAAAGYANFRVELHPGVDQDWIAPMGNGETGLKCLRSLTGPPELAIADIAPVKGGATKWDGAIVYATLTGQWTDIYRRYAQKLGHPEWTDPVTKVRILFRYDPPTSSWTFMPKTPQSGLTWDFGSGGGGFATTNVPQQLMMD